jgi:NhaP-type Na+/H+ or K+/H+ antiporter
MISICFSDCRQGGGSVCRIVLLLIIFYSGANDGMGFPFLFLAVYLLSEPTVGEAIGKWFYLTWLFQIALSCVIGLVVGYVARKILQWSERK